MRQRDLRFEGDRFAVLGDGLVRLASFVQRFSQTNVGGPKPLINFDGLTEFGDRFVQMLFIGDYCIANVGVPGAGGATPKPFENSPGILPLPTATCFSP